MKTRMDLNKTKKSLKVKSHIKAGGAGSGSIKPGQGDMNCWHTGG